MNVAIESTIQANRTNYRSAPVCWTCKHGHFKRGGSGVANRKGVCLLSSADRPFPNDWHPTNSFWMDQGDGVAVLRDPVRFSVEQAPHYLSGHNEYMRPDKISEEHSWLIWIEDLPTGVQEIGWNQVCDEWEAPQKATKPVIL